LTPGNRSRAFWIKSWISSVVFERLIRDVDRKVFVILDNLKVHHAKLVQAWLAEHASQIEVFYLPSYSPELNPDEGLNGSLKQELRRHPTLKTKATLTKLTEDHLKRLDQSPERVMKFFEHEPVRYAAAS
jgi:transposase